MASDLWSRRTTGFDARQHLDRLGGVIYIMGQEMMMPNHKYARRKLFTCLAVGLLAVGTVLSLSTGGSEPIAVRLVDRQTLNSSGSRSITVEFTRTKESGLFLSGDPSVQLRLEKGWQAAVKLPKIDFLSKTNRQTVVLSVPPETQACRFLVEYRDYRGGQPAYRTYCRVFSFLQRHGLLVKYPRVSGLVLKCFLPRLRRSTLEVTLPAHQAC